MSQYDSMTPEERLALAIDYIAYGVRLPAALREFVNLEDDHGKITQGRRTARKRVTPRLPKASLPR